MKNSETKSDEVFKQIILSSPELSGLLEDMGYGPWRAAQEQIEREDIDNSEYEWGEQG